MENEVTNESNKNEAIEFKKNRNSLSRLQKFHKKIFNKNEKAILLVDVDSGDIVDANIRACEFYNYKADDIKKMNITQITILSETEVFEKLHQSQKKHLQRFYFQHRLANGEIKDVMTYSGPLRILGKKLVYLIVEDITEEIKVKKELKKSEVQYKELFNSANDAIFFIEANDNATLKCFIDVNDKACELLGYSKEELLEISPMDISTTHYNLNNIMNEYKKNSNTTRKIYETSLITKNGYHIPTEISVHIFELNEKTVYLAILRDITDRKEAEETIVNYSRLLEGIVKGIPDIVGVFSPDNTIMLCNQAGYDFFGEPFDKIYGRKCYEILNKNLRCEDCPLMQAVKTKKIVRLEKFYEVHNKYFDCYYNPVLDKSGEVIFVVGQLRDITERKKLEDILKESEERYRKIVNLSPDAIIITVDGKLVFANEQACKLVDTHLDVEIGKSVHKFAPGFEKIINKRNKQIIEERKLKTTFDYKIVTYNNKMLDVEISSSFLVYNGKPAVQSVIRDITERKRELNSAAKIQKQILPKEFPIPDKAKMEALYVPAKTVSGDFYMLHKVNDNLVIGIIGDVSGKGITAALNISAFNVLFHEAVLVSNDPSQIIKEINNKVDIYCRERYIAACCFSLDFENYIAKIVGAGINRFIYQNRKDKYEERIIKGPFLGMFENSVFDEQSIHFHTGDKFYFFTDGLDFIYDDNYIKEKYLKTATMTEIVYDLNNYLKDTLTNIKGLKDDSTLLAIEIK